MRTIHTQKRDLAPSTVRARRPLAGLVLAMSLAACGADPTPRSIAEEVVIELARGNTSVIDARFQPGFIDNAAEGARGTAGLSDRVAAQRAAHPGASARVYRVMAEGDLVFVHSNLVLDAGTRGFAVADFFRFEGGRIAERWSNRQEVPAKTASGNDMFSTLSAPQRLDPDPAVDPAATKQVMAALGTALAVNKDLSAWDKYTQAPYYQHSTNTPNGIEAVKAIWGPIVADPSVVITPGNTLADGDLYVTTNRIDSPNVKLTTVDLSRVRGGKVLEHWDVVQPHN